MLGGVCFVCGWVKYKGRVRVNDIVYVVVGVSMGVFV